MADDQPKGGSGGDDASERPQRGGPQQFVMIFAFVILIFILFDNNLRIATGNAAGAVLGPLITFNGDYPVVTLFLAGTIMILLSTAIRHFFIDWVKMARIQEVNKAFQQEFREARQENNTYKIKRLTDAQPEIMKLQTEISSDQMKPMAFTMLIVIPIFAWLLIFVDGLGTPAATLPWASYWNLTDNWWILPHWVMLYSLVSIPIGQVAQKALKLIEYRRLNAEDAEAS